MSESQRLRVHEQHIRFATIAPGWHNPLAGAKRAPPGVIMRTSLLALAIPAVFALGCQKSTPTPAAAPAAAAVKPAEVPAAPAPQAAQPEAPTGATAGAIVAAPAAEAAPVAPAEGATIAAADGAQDGDAPKAKGCGGCGGACGGEAKAEDKAAAPTACTGEPSVGVAAPEGVAAPAAATAAHFGEAFTLTDSVAVDDVMSRPDDFSGKTIRVAANITKVCKKKGCWFVVAGEKADGAYIRVTMKDYGFFVPLDADGRKAVVEGVFTKVDVPEVARKHLAEDGKEDPTKVQGSAVELTLVATAIDITTP